LPAHARFRGDAWCAAIGALQNFAAMHGAAFAGGCKLFAKMPQLPPAAFFSFTQGKILAVPYAELGGAYMV
jgi:hypothetical protein